MLESRAQIQLPLDKLLEQLKTPGLSSRVVPLNLIFLEKAFLRAPAEKRAASVPALLSLLDKR
jgi:hypothetical protein